MSGDSLVYDMSNMTEGQPSVFVKRDWLNIQDQNNGNYGSNQIIVDTSALANSNKYMAYREAYLSIPLVLSTAAPVISSVGITGNLGAQNKDISNVLLNGAAPTSAQANAMVNAGISGTGIASGATIASVAISSDSGACTITMSAASTNTAATTNTELTLALGSTDQSGTNYYAGVVNKTTSRIVSLKNWFGSIIHSLTLDYAGTTILQQTPWQSMWTMFGLMTTLGLSDIEMNASTIGFYPDSAYGWQWRSNADKAGVGACWNTQGGMWLQQTNIDQGLTGSGNIGPSMRQLLTITDPTASSGGDGAAMETIQNMTMMSQLYRSLVASYIKPNDGKATAYGIVYQIQAQIYLRHIHSFFSQVPLLKGVFFRLTLNINQPVVQVQRSTTGVLSISSIVSPLGGVVPIMIAGSSAPKVALTSGSDDVKIQPADQYAVATPLATCSLQATLNVGNTVINQSQNNYLGSPQTQLNRSCFLYVPSYTFNPTFEESYLSRPTKQIVYTDIYQFTTSVVKKESQFNFLLTNGISNIKSILILPFMPNIATSGELGANATVAYPPYQSPFDCAGCGPTSPLSSIMNFNVVVAGQNMIYNTQQYNFEQFLNQFVGVNSINANLTDGLTSGLVDFQSFQQAYNYYYINCSRMLPIDEAVPKSVSIQGTNQTLGSIQYLCFIEYGVQVSVDVLTGARV